MMRTSSTLVVTWMALLVSVVSVNGFMTCPTTTAVSHATTSSLAMNAPPVVSEPTEVADVEIPTNLPSERNMDYVPLATMLATGQLAQADQVSTKQQQQENVVLSVGDMYHAMPIDLIFAFYC